MTKLLGVLLFLSLALICRCGKVKVIEEPFSFNNPQGGHPSQGDRGEVPLITRYLPNPPSGPPYFIEHLNGKCFDYISNNYKYRFCPYQNITQREQTYRWNSFHGVLGVWKSWEIENGTFDSMLMAHGDICQGNLDREIKVKLICGDDERVLSVSEPSMCRYQMLFQTRFACPTDVFQVYPVLSEHGRFKYEDIEQFYVNKEITSKGYKKYMKELYIEEGVLYETMAIRKSLVDEPVQKARVPQQYHYSNNKGELPVKESPIHTVDESDDGVESYSSLMNRLYSKSQCVEKYRQALKEIEVLRDVIRQNALQQNNMFNIQYKSKNVVEIKSSDKPKNLREEALLRKKDDNVLLVNDTNAITTDGISTNKTINNSRHGHISETHDSQNNRNRTFDIVKNNELSKAKNQTSSKAKRKGDDGLIDESEHPLRLLQSRMAYSKNLRNMMKIHSKERTGGNMTISNISKEKTL